MTDEPATFDNLINPVWNGVPVIHPLYLPLLILTEQLCHYTSYKVGWIKKADAWVWKKMVTK